MAIPEVVVQGCSVKKVFLKILQNSHENTCARCFPVKFAKFLRTYFEEHMRTTASKNMVLNENMSQQSLRFALDGLNSYF